MKRGTHCTGPGVVRSGPRAAGPPWRCRRWSAAVECSASNVASGETDGRPRTACRSRASTDDQSLGKAATVPALPGAHRTRLQRGASRGIHRIAVSVSARRPSELPHVLDGYTQSRTLTYDFARGNYHFALRKSRGSGGVASGPRGAPSVGLAPGVRRAAGAPPRHGEGAGTDDQDARP